MSAEWESLCLIELSFLIHWEAHKDVLFASAHDNSGEGVTAAVAAQMMERTGFRKLSTYLALLLLVKGALVKDLYYTGTETTL